MWYGGPAVPDIRPGALDFLPYPDTSVGLAGAQAVAVWEAPGLLTGGQVPGQWPGGSPRYPGDTSDMGPQPCLHRVHLETML